MHSRKITDISIIIPAYNESDSLEELFELLKLNTNSIHIDSEYIFIDDGSTDKTSEVVKTLIKNNKTQRIILIAHKRNLGKTQALRNGIQASSGNYILMIDADLQDDPGYLAKFWNHIKSSSFDMVVGNRIKRYKNNYLKKFSSFTINRLVRLIAGYSISDMNCGYKIMNRECAKSLNLKSDYHRYIPFLAMISGFSVGEIEIEQKERKHGESKYGKTGIQRLMKSLMDIISISFIYKFRENPFDLFGRIGVILSGLGGLILAYLGFRWLQGYYIEGRPLFFVGILFIIIGINNISLGLLGELIDINSNKPNANKNTYTIYRNSALDSYE